MRNTTPGFPRVKADFEKQINDLISDDNKINEIITRLKSSEDYRATVKCCVRDQFIRRQFLHSLNHFYLLHVCHSQI